MPKGEVAFFESHAYSNSSIKDLEKMFKHVPENQVVGIKRPYYLSCNKCASRIKKHIPDIKLVVILRNPMERAISAYFHYMKMGLLPIRHPNEGLNDVLRNIHNTKYPKSKTILENGLYYKHLSHYLKYFDRSQLLVITLNDIKKNPNKVMKKAYKFLGVNSKFTPKSLKIIPQKGLYSLVSLKIRSLAFPLFYKYGKVRRGVVHKKNSQIFKCLAYVIFFLAKLINKFMSDNKKDIDKRIRASLLKFYSEDTGKLAEIIDNKETINWTKNS